MMKWLRLREEAEYLRISRTKERNSSIFNINAITRKSKKRREILIQKETVSVSRFIQTV